MSLIELNNITKHYGNNETEIFALNNINLKIEKGDLVAIMGPSGSGKSTLLNILGFIDVPSDGEYLLNGKSLKGMSAETLASVRNESVGFIFQNFNLLNEQNLIYNVSLPLLYSKNKKNASERAIEMLNKVGLDKKQILKSANKLSGGQKQRVAIARALVNNPDIILADEPTGALDIETGEKILNMLIDINNQGKTVVIITHDINVANKCNRIINIVDGKISE